MAGFREIVRHVATYSVGILIGRLASIILLPIYTRFLTPADYGVLELLEISSSVINTLTALHLSDAFFFFYSKETEEKGQRTVLMTAYTGAIIAGVMIWLAGAVSARSLSVLVLGTPVYAPGFQIVLIYSLLGFVQELGFAHLRAQNQSKKFLALQFGRLVLQASLTVALLHYVGGYLCVPGGATIATAIIAGGFLCEGVVRHRARVSWTLLKSMFRYAFPLGVSGGAMLFVHFGDRFFLERAVPLKDLGLYSLAYKVSMVVASAQFAFVTYWKAQMFSVFKESSGARLYVRLFTYYILVLSVAAVCIAAGAAPGLVVLTTKPFYPAAVFVPLLTGAYVIRGAGDYWRTPLLVEDRPGLNARVMIWTALACLVFYATLIPRFHVWGAVAATLGAFVFMTALSFWEAQRLRHFHFETGRLLRIGICMGATLILLTVIRPQQMGWQIAMSAAAVLMFGVGLLASGFFEPEEREWAARAWRHTRGWLATARSAG